MEDRRVLVDTGLFIEHIRAKDKKSTTLAALSDWAVELSSVTIFELLIGSKRYERQQEVWQLIEGLSIHHVDERIAEQAAEIFRILKKRNQLIEFRDLFIAATAMVHNLPVKTLNTSHFSRVEGLTLL